MRNLKKFLALVLAMMMAFSLMTTVSAQNVEFGADGSKINDAFIDDITVLAGMGVIKGVTANEFQPQAPVTRAEMAAIVYRLATGDANDRLTYAYAGYGDFTDVSSDKWYAGYVGYCANAGLIKGYGDGRFGPSNPVTGYEALVMLLRAMGYDQPDEFSGSNWREHAASIATQRGLLAKVNTTRYQNTLSQSATREFAAEVAFQAATKAMVQYTAAFGYQTTGMSGVLKGEDNPTLGERWYGLTSLTGIIVGNQATGENDTLLGLNATGIWDASGILTDVEVGTTGSYAYASTTGSTTTAALPRGNLTLAFDEATGLDMFGHKAIVWYDYRSSQGTTQFDSTVDVYNDYSTTYAVLDKAEKVGYVYAEDGVLSVASPDGTNDKLAVAAQAAGFSVQPDTGKANPSTTHFSDRYSQMGVLENDISTTGQVSPISTYALISNNGNKTVDVVIALSAEVAQITQKNTTNSTPYLVLGSSAANASTFGNGTTAGVINLSQLTDESLQDLGEVVTAYEIAGTGETLATAKTKITNGDSDFMYQLEAMETKTATVSSYRVSTPSALAIDTTPSAVISVNLVGESSAMLLSGITRGNGTTSEIISGILPVVGSLVANTQYTVYVDKVGRFISLTSSSDYEFLYGTYADFEVGALGTGTIGYNMVGVNWDGQKLGNNVLKTIGNNAINGTLYNNLTVTRKDYGNASSTTIGNEIKGGYNTGYMYNADTDDLRVYGGSKLVDGATWTITSRNASNGFVKVNNSVDGTSGRDYLLTKDTHFIVVSGTGTATLDVKEYTGLTEFLDGAAEAAISYTTFVPGVTNGDEVIFTTDAEKYGTVDTEDNGVITQIILSDGNLNRWNNTTMFFNYNQTTDTGMVLPGTDGSVKQYELWSDGQAGYFFVDTDAVGGVDPNVAMTFYNLVKIDEVNGMPVYKAVTAANNSGKGNLTGAGYASDSVTYNYITVSTLDTGLFADTNLPNGTVFSIAGANVCDVQYMTNSSTGRNEITTLRELNNAVSVRQPDGSTMNYTISVAIVYSGVEVSCIYVTGVTAS